MKHLSHSFFISNRPLEIFDGKFVLRPCGIFYFGSTSLFPCTIIPTDEFVLSLENLKSAAGETNRQNSVRISGEKMTVTGSDMNTLPVYIIDDEESGTVIIFNDLFLAAPLLRSLGIQPSYDATAFAQRLTFFAEVERLGPGEQITVLRKKNELTVSTQQFSDILLQESLPYKELQESENRFFGALNDAVKQSVSSIENVNIALSGGIDSGTIAWLIHQHHPNLKAYTVSTDWGNEYNEAKEAADYLGIPLENIHISTDTFREELPHVIRYFSFVHPESIEIALVAHCMYKELQKRDPASRVFLTGYGSDLLNAGIFAPFEHHDELHAEILTRLRKTQWSNEFSNLSALCNGTAVHHPFWNSEVIAQALRVPAQFKVLEGQDKFYFRNMMKERLPSATVWRKKLGVHQGTGLSQHLQNMFREQTNGKKNGSDGYSDTIFEEHAKIFLHGNYN